jgi:hypothetical protein
LLHYHKGLYGPNTPIALVAFIEEELEASQAYLGFHRKRKLTIQYGNTLTGKAWVDKPVTGFIELLEAEGGTEPILRQLIIKKQSGRKTHDVVLINNIVRISTEYSVHYRHPLFHTHSEKPPVVEETQSTGRALRGVRLGRNASDNSESAGN